MKFESCNNEGNEFKSRVKNDVSTDFGHFQVTQKLKELAYICVRCKNMFK